MLSSLSLNEEDSEYLQKAQLLTSKSYIYVANVGEDQTSGNEYSKKLEEIAARENTKCIVLSAKLEEELAAMEDEEKQMFMAEYGLEKSGLEKLVTVSYDLLGLISYLTAGEKEVRAWTIKRGTKAPQAAGQIHTDFEKGFIRAEIVDYETLIAEGSMANAREKGKVRSEGKDYVMRDNDVVLFRFNV